MTITVDWNSPEQHYLIANYYSGWTLSDFKTLKQETDALLLSVDYDVDALVIFHSHKNLSDIHRPPTGASLNVAKAFNTAPANLNRIYVINAGQIMKIMIKIAQTLVPNTPADQIEFIATTEKAKEILEDNWNKRTSEQDITT